MYARHHNIWDRDELLTIIKYEPEIRNKAILTLLWDLDARNHEITSLKIGNIRLRERYAEGEIPYDPYSTIPMLRTMNSMLCQFFTKYTFF